MALARGRKKPIKRQYMLSDCEENAPSVANEEEKNANKKRKISRRLLQLKIHLPLSKVISLCKGNEQSLLR